MKEKTIKDVLTHSIRRGEGDSDSAGSRREQHDEHRGVAIESVNETRALLHRRAAVQPHVREVHLLHHALHYVQHASGLREEKDFLSFLVPHRQHFSRDVSRGEVMMVSISGGIDTMSIKPSIP